MALPTTYDSEAFGKLAGQVCRHALNYPPMSPQRIFWVDALMRHVDRVKRSTAKEQR